MTCPLHNVGGSDSGLLRISSECGTSKSPRVAKVEASEDLRVVRRIGRNSPFPWPYSDRTYSRRISQEGLGKGGVRWMG